MGIEANQIARQKDEGPGIDCNEKAIQDELSANTALLNSLPAETKRNFEIKRLVGVLADLRRKQGVEVPADGESATGEDDGFEEYTSLVNRRIQLIDERNAFYANNPAALKERLKEIVKISLRENLSENTQERDDFLKWKEAGSGATPRMMRPKEGSPNEREFRDLQYTWNETHPYEKIGRYDNSYLREAETEVYEELKVQPSTDGLATPKIQERVSPQTSEFMTNHIIQQDLSYQDAELPDEQKEQMLNWSRSSDSAKKYAESLANASSARGLETVRNMARQMRDTMLSVANRLNIPVSPHGKSVSWAMWDTGKQYHFFTHQNERAEGYEIADPLASEAKREEIINRQLGWEAYAAFQKNSAFRESVLKNPAYANALGLLNKIPKAANGTLSSKDLAELGKILRGNQ